MNERPPTDLFDEQNNYRAFDALNSLLKKISGVYIQMGQSALWWRGQKRGRADDWMLRPKIHRPQPNQRPYGLGDEYELLTNFQMGARVRYPSWPTGRMQEELVLAQHYGLPTRLLDWSISLLPALFFAVSGDLNCPGILWALYPQKLNSAQTERHGCFDMAEPTPAELVREAFTHPDDLREAPQRILAVVPPQVDLRMMVQGSMFTIHRNQAPTLEDEHPECVRCIEISAEQKPLLMTALEICGITKAGLFPDLESLASDLIDWNPVRRR